MVASERLPSSASAVDRIAAFATAAVCAAVYFFIIALWLWNQNRTLQENARKYEDAFATCNAELHRVKATDDDVANALDARAGVLTQSVRVLELLLKLVLDQSVRVLELLLKLVLDIVAQ
jgi:hypothetical protein